MEFKDQLNRIIHLEKIPRRIVSLVPSITELLAYFDMNEEVVGITKFCIKPENWLQEKTIVGGTKQIHLDKIRALKPDLIIANKEENTKEIVESLEHEFPVYVTDIYTLEDTYEAIKNLASILAKEEYAQTLISTTKKQFSMFKSSDKFQELIGKRFLYFCWHKPDMIAAKNTYIDYLFNQLGMINASHGNRYPECTYNEKPHYIFLSSEPYPFQEKHIAYFQEKYPKAKIILVDGEIFSWYGSRIQFIVPYVEALAF
jgi:ABC-type Fe3+-hydroxamate transport system substrate-binding protein